MARYAIGDVQGCYQPLRALLRRLHFTPDRDELYFVGDLVNRGPQSLQVLRFVRSLGAGAHTVLGNHDLHLLALHHAQRAKRAGDTLDEVLAARDRGPLLDWLIERPLVIDNVRQRELIVHAGIVPDWTLRMTLDNAREASRALLADPRGFLTSMYGNKPDRWRDVHGSTERHRFTVNVLTRLRYCRADGTLDMKLKEAPGGNTGPWRPWFEHPSRLRTRRVIFGHWSTLGLMRRARLVALDTGCVWGGALTAVNLDDSDAPPFQTRCAACQQPGGD
ncbi:MAG: symmetrical bis(5'-nucleosyl)-tetraphosphatase [Steroidobacteraceae bacterium]